MVNFFSFFTIQSNIIGAVAVTIAALAGPAARGSVWLSQLRGAATLYMGVTGMIFSLLLSGADVQTPIPWVNSVLHYIFPLFIVIDWLVDRSVRPLALRQGLVFLVYPVAYLAYSLIRGPIVDWYPYPFLDPQEQRLRLRRDDEGVRRRGRAGAGLAAVLDIAAGLRPTTRPTCGDGRTQSAPPRRSTS